MAPAERVVQAGWLLIDTLGEMPTQDEVVECLMSSQPDGLSTGKGTVNKYWPQLGASVMARLRSQETLKDLPESIVKHFRAIVDWAQDHSTLALSHDRQLLEKRLAEVDAVEAGYANERGLLQARINEQALELASANQRAAEALANRDLRVAELAEVKTSLLVSQQAVATAQLEGLRLDDRVQGMVAELAGREETIAAQQNTLSVLKVDHIDVLAVNTGLQNQLSGLQTQATLELARRTQLEERLYTATQTLEKTTGERDTALADTGRLGNSLARQSGELAAITSQLNQLPELSDRNRALERQNAALQAQLTTASMAAKAVKHKKTLGG
jgi:chromosome segregation ATPase